MDAKKLQEENAVLKTQLRDSRTLFNQLVEERSTEQFDERRIYLLKSQVVQLERQILLMSESLASRSATLLEVENSLNWLADQCRSHIAADVKGPEVPVPRSSLTEMVHKVESSRIKLYKNIENSSPESTFKPILFYNEFVKPASQGEVTLFDICTGNVGHLNLKQVAKLESQLSQLYGDLIALNECLTRSPAVHKLTAPPSDDRRNTLLLKAAARVDQCAHNLLSLSLLFPSAPWPVLKRPLCGDITTEKIISSLPALPRSKTTEVQKVVDAFSRASNHCLHLKDKEIDALREELNFHRALDDLQTEYTESLLGAVKTGYKEFEDSVEESLCKPLKEILNAYETLKTSSSEDSLRTFLGCFKDRADELGVTVSSLSRQNEDYESPGQKGLSEFGKLFISAIQKHCDACRKLRDKAASEDQTLKTQQEKLDASLRSLLEQMKAKKSGSDRTEAGDFSRHDKDELRKNKEDGPSVEFCVKTKHHQPCDETTDVSVKLGDLSLDNSDISESDAETCSAVLRPNTRRSIPPRPSSKERQSPNSAHYAKNKTLNLRRSGSLSRIGKLKYASTSVDTEKTGFEKSNSPKETKVVKTYEEGQTDSAAIPTARPRRKIPTLKPPFR